VSKKKHKVKRIKPKPTEHSYRARRHTGSMMIGESFHLVLKRRVIEHNVALIDPKFYNATVNPKEDKNRRIIYPDEKTRRAWEILERAQAVIANIPPEGEELNIQAVTFSPEYEFDGWNVVFTVGTVIPTDKDTIMLVPQRTLDVLSRMDIPYELILFPLGQ
jgi:hypothetical protein